MKQHTTPCNQCPWRRNSAPGWLGASTPEDFLEQGNSDIRMPCHVHIDYDRDDWEDKINEVPRCAGRAIYLRNRCKSPRDSSEREFTQSVKPDSADVFQWPQEFLDHHNAI